MGADLDSQYQTDFQPLASVLSKPAVGPVSLLCAL